MFMSMILCFRRLMTEGLAVRDFRDNHPAQTKLYPNVFLLRILDLQIFICLNGQKPK